jgi:hypothetical protein
MSRRVPCIALLFAVIVAVLLPLTPTTGFAGEEEDGGGLVLNRYNLDVDEIKPGDDDQPTISGRRRGTMTSQSTYPGDQDDAVIGRGTDTETTPVAPIEVLRTWIATLRGLIERSETLR